jgi:hypothetical protein
MGQAGDLDDAAALATEIEGEYKSVHQALEAYRKES